MAKELAELMTTLRRPCRGLYSVWGTITSVSPLLAIPDTSVDLKEIPVRAIRGVPKVNDRTVLIRMQDSWMAVGPAALGVGCPDIGALLNPVDKSFSLTFEWTNTGGGDFHRHYGTGTYTPYPGSGYQTFYQIPSNRMWCVSDFHVSLTMLDQVAPGWQPECTWRLNFFHSMYMPHVIFNGPFVVGDTIEQQFQGASYLLYEGYRVEASTDSVALTGGRGTARFKIDWTATEFDDPSQST